MRGAKETRTPSARTYVRIQILNIDDCSECDNGPLYKYSLGLCVGVFIYLYIFILSVHLAIYYQSKQTFMLASFNSNRENNVL